MLFLSTPTSSRLLSPIGTKFIRRRKQWGKLICTRKQETVTMQKLNTFNNPNNTILPLTFWDRKFITGKQLKRKVWTMNFEKCSSWVNGTTFRHHFCHSSSMPVPRLPVPHFDWMLEEVVGGMVYLCFWWRTIPEVVAAKLFCNPFSGWHDGTEWWW